ncbi:MAG: hypothetical protein ACREX3_19695 [Gammaproteobacteria bacterium]
MKRTFLLTAALTASVICPTAIAGGYVDVDGYYRDGTYVAAYIRSYPNDSVYDNLGCCPRPRGGVDASIPLQIRGPNIDFGNSFLNGVLIGNAIRAGQEVEEARSVREELDAEWKEFYAWKANNDALIAAMNAEAAKAKAEGAAAEAETLRILRAWKAEIDAGKCKSDCAMAYDVAASLFKASVAETRAGIPPLPPGFVPEASQPAK